MYKKILHTILNTLPFFTILWVAPYLIKDIKIGDEWWGFPYFITATMLVCFTSTLAFNNIINIWYNG